MNDHSFKRNPCIPFIHRFGEYLSLLKFSDGMYACEVSTEGPSFSTIRSERDALVVNIVDRRIDHILKEYIEVLYVLEVNGYKE
ncbi:unnamed protein product [Medioppia subpectinata]|uniref:Uncharacterized protein n=1 Tax=Medioppia subpectinata TaxID=1979941 RepID=A0A7R9KPB8_9ACAR|nr:unnamed protein product [Medioppia subpectinata]CAG2105912.1 unnamed protein product [Medioppia subpectinata]